MRREYIQKQMFGVLTLTSDNYFAGNYMNNLLAATKDLCERAMTQIEYLEEREIERNRKNKQRDRGEER